MCFLTHRVAHELKTCHALLGIPPRVHVSSQIYQGTTRLSSGVCRLQTDLRREAAPPRLTDHFLFTVPCVKRHAFCGQPGTKGCSSPSERKSPLPIVRWAQPPLPSHTVPAPGTQPMRAAVGRAAWPLSLEPVPWGAVSHQT